MSHQKVITTWDSLLTCMVHKCWLFDIFGGWSEYFDVILCWNNRILGIRPQVVRWSYKVLTKLMKYLFGSRTHYRGLCIVLISSDCRVTINWFNDQIATVVLHQLFATANQKQKPSFRKLTLACLCFFLWNCCVCLFYCLTAVECCPRLQDHE